MRSTAITALWLLASALPLQAQTLPPDLTLTEVSAVHGGALAVRHAGDGSGRLFVVRQGGRIDVIRANGSVDASFLNIGSGGTAPPLGFTTGGERGLLGLAFHPQYAVNGRFFVSYTDGGGDTAIAEYQVSGANPDRGDPASGRVVLRVYQPANNHNGGDIHFGPDGYLYIGMGDGGGGNDSACGTGQALIPSATSCSIAGGDTFLQPPVANAPRGNNDSRALLGKMLRIDIDVETPRAASPAGADLCGADSDTGIARYDIPADNPFAGNGGSNAAACDEIYHYGLRNPWRFSFDRATDELIIGDVGQDRWEEVNLVPPGGGRNFAWAPCEGFHVRGSTTTLCTLPGRTDPILAYQNTGSYISVTGGFRYRGPWPALDGVLFFADVGGDGGALFAQIEGMSGWSTPPSPWMTGLDSLVGFGEDEGGNVYVANLEGTVRRVSLSTPPPGALNVNAFAALETDAGVIGRVDAGDIVRFTATVLNTGGETLDTLALTLSINGGATVPMTCAPTTLAINQGATCSTIDYTVTQADFDLGAPITGEVDADALDVGDDPVADADSVTLRLSPPNPQLALQKTAQIAPDAGTLGVANAGDGVTYDVTVTNTGNVTLDELEVFDQLDGGPLVPLTCAPATLPPQAQTSCNPYGFTVSQDQIELQQPLLNVASAEARDPANILMGASDDATVAVVTAAPQLTVDKTASLTVDGGATGLADRDDVIGYSVSVTNTGNVRLAGLVVTDSFAGAAPQALSCAPTTLEPQQVATCTAYQHTVTQADVDAGVALTNLAAASATRVGGGAPVQASDDAIVAVVPAAPQLTVDKTASLTVDGGATGLADRNDVIGYAVSVSNTGNVRLAGLVVTDSFAGAAPQALSCAPTTLDPQQVATCTAYQHTVTQADVDAGVALTNLAAASATRVGGGAPLQASDGASIAVVTAQPALALDKQAALQDLDADLEADVGETIAYSFSVQNTGNVTLSTVSVLDPQLGGTVTCTPTSLAPGTSSSCGPIDYPVVANDLDTASIVNTAIARATPPAGGTTDSPSDSTTTPTDQGDIIFGDGFEE